MSWIFHILPRSDWDEAQQQGEYTPASLEAEGFIHMSKVDQLMYVANNIFKGMDHLVLLKVSEEDVTSKLVHEPPAEAPNSGMVFPHIYGPLNLDSVKRVFEFKSEEDGIFKLPEGLLQD